MTEPPNTEAAMATLRRALTMDAGTIMERRHTAGHAALDAIASELENWKHEYHEACKSLSKRVRQGADAVHRAEAAETELERVRKESAEWEERYEELLAEVGGVWPG